MKTAEAGLRATMDEAQIEKLLSAKLMEGYVLLESCCPVCSTPLVKNHIKKGGPKYDDNDSQPVKQPVLLDNDSFEKPFKPVNGVPICVVCKSHVITQESEIDILEQCSSLKDKGSILLALNESSASYTTNTHDDEEEEYDDHEPVVISVESLDRDGEDNIVELVSSPKEGDKQKPIIVEEENHDYEMSFEDATNDGSIIKSKSDISDVMEEYSVRREIATKVLGAKMLQGYTLKETTCDRCGMPLMENKGKVDCVVCPALVKKAKKKLKAQQRSLQEKSLLERQIQANRDLEKQMKEEQLELERRVKEERLQQFREEEVVRERLAKQQKDVEQEKAKLLAMEQKEMERIRALEAEEARLLQEAQMRASDVSRREEEDRLFSRAKQEESNQRLTEVQRETQALLAARNAAEMAKQKEEAQALLEETRRLEALEAERSLETGTMVTHRLEAEKARRREEERKLLEEAKLLESMETETLANKSECMKRDLLEQEHRRRLLEKARLDEEIARLEEERIQEELDLRKCAEEKRSEDEAKLIAALEADAAGKALAAEEAIRKAKEALETVSSTKRDIIAQTIAMAEREAVAETEQTIKAELEDYKERVVLPSEAQLYKERWETLRMEGRAIMTRRVLQGWQLLPQACKGAECEMSPLIIKHGKKECVVCGGTGNGEDGVYTADDAENEVPFSIANIDPALVPETILMNLSLDKNRSTEIENRFLEYDNEEEFDHKREMVSKEIGKRMLLGWSLLDASCPKCVMPLMMDNMGNRDICVLCGPLEPFMDASTIKTKEITFAAENQVLGEDKKKQQPAQSGEEMVMANTDATVASATGRLPSLPSMKEDELLKSIRERSGMQKKSPAPRGDPSDPPALTKGVSKAMYSLADSEDSDDGKSPLDNAKQDAEPSDNFRLTIPKDFDFADPDALRDLLNKAGSNEGEPRVESVEVTKSGDSRSEKNLMSTEMVAKMFLRSPHGYDFQDIGMDMSLEEIKELVDIFMATNFNETVPDDFKFDVARDILEKLQPEVDYVVEPAILFDPEPSPQHSSTPTSGVICLENMGSPLSPGEDDPAEMSKSFHFGEYESRLSRSSRKGKPTPETMSSAFRPMSKPPKSPTIMRPPRMGGSGTREGAPIVVGGPLSPNNYPRRPHHHYNDGMRSIGGASRAESVASDALESIYVRIDHCKQKLMDPTNSIEEQLATADLMEKLAKAAVAMKAMESIENYE